MPFLFIDCCTEETLSGSSDSWQAQKSLHNDRNQVFLRIGDEILVVDERGEIVCELEIGSVGSEEVSWAQNKQLEGDNGRVYYLVTGAAQRIVYEVVESGESYCLQAMTGKDWEEQMIADPSETFHGSPGGMLYNGSDGLLWQYSSREGKWKELLRWSDSDLRQGMQEIVWISDSRLFASDDSNEGGTAAHEFYLLDNKSVEELPEKEELVLAYQEACSDELEDAVIQFNRSNDRYHITIKVYIGEDSLVRLDAAMVSSRPPDMLVIEGQDVAKYGNKQALEDLAAYLDGSGFLSREDFLSGILEGYTVDGRLVGIPSTFIWHTLFGYTSEVGTRIGWTMEDMAALTQEYPGRKLNGRSFYRNLDTTCADYIMERFIDQEKGECDFDSEEFGRLIKWLAEHLGTGTDYYASEKVEEPLIFTEMMADVVSFLRYASRSEEKMTMIGYPSMDGHPLHHALTYNAVGITAKSRNKEGAWQFIEYFLTLQEAQVLANRLPTRKDMLDRILEDAQTPVYSREQ